MESRPLLSLLRRGFRIDGEYAETGHLSFGERRQVVTATNSQGSLSPPSVVSAEEKSRGGRVVETKRANGHRFEDGRGEKPEMEAVERDVGGGLLP